MINIFIADVSKLNPYDGRVTMLLTPERRERISTLLSEEKKKQCAAAGLLLRHAFICYGHSPDTPVLIGENGKPFCEKMNFSLSHSGCFALCAVADCAVGADIEKINPAQNMKSAKKFCTEDEMRGINLYDFFRIFTAKESYLKMTGEGLARDMRSFKADAVAHLQAFEYCGYMISVCTEAEQKAKICPVSLL